MKTMPSERLLRVSEGARELALKESTLRAWILTRRIRVVRIGRRAIRIPMSEVVRLIEEGTVPALADQR
jgi:excisionase family DNA binding protein